MMEYVPYEHRQEDAATFNLYINFEAGPRLGAILRALKNLRLQTRFWENSTAVWISNNLVVVEDRKYLLSTDTYILSTETYIDMLTIHRCILFWNLLKRLCRLLLSARSPVCVPRSQWIQLWDNCCRWWCYSIILLQLSPSPHTAPCSPHHHTPL